MTSPTKAEVQLYAPSMPDQPHPVQQANILLAQTGNWSISLDQMAGDDAVTSDSDGTVTVQWSGSTLQGYVIRAAPDRGVWQALIVGGKGGLNKPVTAQHFYQTPAKKIVSDILAQVGETLAADSTGLDTTVNYPRRAVAASRCLDELCDVLGIVWRVKLDGTVWLGTYTWPIAKATFVYSKSGNENDAKLVPDAGQPLLEPGTTVVLDATASATAQEKSAQKIAVAYYTIDNGRSNAQIWLVDPSADLQTDDKLAPDRMHAGIAALSLQALRGVDWYRSFQGKVVRQSPDDGTLDVTLDVVRGVGEMPPIRGVQVSTVVGGASRRVRADERCTVIFEAGDFRRPRAMEFESAFNSSSTLGVARETDTVDRNSDMATWMGQVQTLNTQLLVALSQIVAAFAVLGTPITPVTQTVVAIGATIATISSSSADLKLPSGTT